MGRSGYVAAQDLEVKSQNKKRKGQDPKLMAFQKFFGYVLVQRAAYRTRVSI